MSIQHPFGWDLPPGCTNADIERAFGDEPECPLCEGDGKDENGNPCKRCDGTGTLDVTKERAEREVDAADREMDLRRDEPAEWGGVDEPRDRFHDSES